MKTSPFTKRILISQSAQCEHKDIVMFLSCDGPFEMGSEPILPINANLMVTATETDTVCVMVHLHCRRETKDSNPIPIDGS